MEAACLPLCGVSRALFVGWQCASGDRVLVLGAPGGVGSYAVQLAARRGAHVIATGPPRTRTIFATWAPRRSSRPGTAARDVRGCHPGGFDGLIDLVNYRPSFLEYLELLAPGGRAASTHRAVDPELFAAKGFSGANVGTAPDRELLERLAKMAAHGELRIPIERVFSLDDAEGGLAYGKGQHSRGKLVITMGDLGVRP